MFNRINKWLRDEYERMLRASQSPNFNAIPPSVLRYYNNITGYEYANFVKKSVRDKKSVLIVGDAGGRDYHLLKAEGKKVTVIDISPQKTIKKLIVSDITKPIPFRNESFDAVVMCEVIEHLFEDYFALQQIRNILKEDGYLILSVPFYHDKCEFHVRIHSPLTIKRLLEYSGFEIIEFVEKGGGIATLDKMRIFVFLKHFANYIYFLAFKKTFYRKLVSLATKIDWKIGLRKNSIHKWSKHYGAFIKCTKGKFIDLSKDSIPYFKDFQVTPKT